MTETPDAGKVSRLKLSARDLIVGGHGDVNVERRAWLGLMNLKRDTVDDRVRWYACLGKDPGKG
jgi:hypothetical protein